MWSTMLAGLMWGCDGDDGAPGNMNDGSTDALCLEVPGDGCSVAYPDGPCLEVDGGPPCLAEECNGLDDDGDGEIDEGDLPGVGEACGQTEGVCQEGVTVCDASPGCVERDDCVVCEGEVRPTAEMCNGLDDDCNGETDNGFDFCTDLFHCGGCNVGCDLNVDVYHAYFVCGACESHPVCPGRPDLGVCKLVACAEGWHDCDADPCSGCEC